MNEADFDLREIQMESISENLPCLFTEEWGIWGQGWIRNSDVFPVDNALCEIKYGIVDSVKYPRKARSRPGQYRRSK